MGVRSIRDLIVWQRSRELAVAVYSLTKGLPREELYGMTSQFRRAAVSVMSNIAEGHGRGSRLQLLHFLAIAKGSTFEVQSQLVLAADLRLGELAQVQHCDALCNEVGRMLTATIASLRGRE